MLSPYIDSSVPIKFWWSQSALSPLRYSQRLWETLSLCSIELGFQNFVNALETSGYVFSIVLLQETTLHRQLKLASLKVFGSVFIQSKSNF